MSDSWDVGYQQIPVLSDTSQVIYHLHLKLSRPIVSCVSVISCVYNSCVQRYYMTEYNLWVKNFVEITLSCTDSEIDVFYREIQDGQQKWQQNIFFCKKVPYYPA